MSTMTDVAIIGAGPYGLAMAAHLSRKGVDRRVFGSPMQTWRYGMPRDMLLKSEGFASCLYDPDRTFSLASYCADHNIPYADIGLPVKRETFASYGMAFQRRFVPDLEERMVESVEPLAGGFTLRLDDGETLTARRLVVAAGIQRFAHTAPELAPLSGPLLSHSSAYGDLEGFAGREVIVVGGGSSAMDIAALLGQAGASVTVVARRMKIAWCGAPRPRTWLDKIREPVSGLGTGWRSLMCEAAPMVFYRMPEAFRVTVVARHLGPAPGWAVRNYVEEHVRVVHASIAASRAEGDRAVLSLRLNEGGTCELSADHVIAATGYRVDVDRLEFLGSGIRSAVRRANHAPALSTKFESSVPGLFFTGAAAAVSFGPLLRFACGAGFAAQRLSSHLAGSAERRSIPAAPSAAPVAA